MADLSFAVAGTDKYTKARAGTLVTDHGAIPTPIFMPVGTVGSVKAINQQQLEELIRAKIILGNTYHLYLRPGTEILEAAGGLHRFMNWQRPLLTDSGGYQVFSLAANRKISEEGVIFQSHIDGSRHLFTPESVMGIQRSIGADIIMAFDECPPWPSEYAYVKTSMELTHRWVKRCMTYLEEHPPLYSYHQYLFPIVQGGTYADLRRTSSEFVASLGAAGNAIGGLSVGEPEELMYEFTGLCCDILPADKPRYLMGVGTPWNLLECISLGVDMFDCVMPTRNGRNGMLFTTQGVINIRNKKWANDFSEIDPGLPSEQQLPYTKAYLRHLFVADELLALELASLQNLIFYLWLVTAAREKIISGDFASWKEEMTQVFRQRL
jgi:queuine tRNA-ribosyltransferase